MPRRLFEVPQQKCLKCARRGIAVEHPSPNEKQFNITTSMKNYLCRFVCSWLLCYYWNSITRRNNLISEGSIWPSLITDSFPSQRIRRYLDRVSLNKPDKKTTKIKNCVQRTAEIILNWIESESRISPVYLVHLVGTPCSTLERKPSPMLHVSAHCFVIICEVVLIQVRKDKRLKFR